MEETQQPPIQLFIPATLFIEADEFLRRHGCTIAVGAYNSGDDIITRTTVILPPGSTRDQTKRIAMVHYRITLPDGVTLREVHNPGTGTSTLDIPAQRSQEGDDEQ